ncbi:MAG: hypothetical protein IT216_11355 [Saprospiraceae bacterium]|nr:hypothetical protein [Saprospiraceae bacterium]
MARSIDDWEARPSVSVAYQVKKKPAVEAAYSLHLTAILHDSNNTYSVECYNTCLPWAVAGPDYRWVKALGSIITNCDIP